MKKILILICLFANIVLSPQAANWQWVNSTSLYSKYIDSESIEYKRQDNLITSATVWAKITRADTKNTEYVQLNLDFENQTTEPLEGRYDNINGVTISPIDKSLEQKLPAIQNFNNTYADYYFYIKGLLEQSNALQSSLSTKDNLKLCGTQKDSNGKVFVYYIDTPSIRKMDDTISGYVIRIGLAPDNTANDWSIANVKIFTKTKQLYNSSEIWGIDKNNFLRKGYTESSITPIFPDSLGEGIYKVIMDYCTKNPEAVTKYNHGIPIKA